MRMTKMTQLIDKLLSLVDDIKSAADNLEEEINDVDLLGTGDIQDDPLYLFVQDIGLDPEKVEKISVGDRLQMRDALNALKVL